MVMPTLVRQFEGKPRRAPDSQTTPPWTVGEITIGSSAPQTDGGWSRGAGGAVHATANVIDTIVQ